jgi:hypothetical protein
LWSEQFNLKKKKKKNYNFYCCFCCCFDEALSYFYNTQYIFLLLKKNMKKSQHNKHTHEYLIKFIFIPGLFIFSYHVPTVKATINYPIVNDDGNHFRSHSTTRLN